MAVFHFPLPSTLAVMVFLFHEVVILTVLLGLASPQRLAYSFCCITMLSEKIFGKVTFASVVVAAATSALSRINFFISLL